MAESIATVGYLAGFCGHDGTGWLKVKTDANGYLYVVGTGTAGAMEVTQDTPGDLLIGQHQYDGSAWRKSNLIFGYNDRYAEAVDDLDAEAGGNLLSTTAVPANYVYVVNFISALNNTTNPSSIALMLNDGTSNYPLYVIQNPGAKIWVYVTPQAILKEGDFCRASIEGCVAGDDIYLRAWGYKMKINM